MLKNLPIGRQTFSELRLADELYIDKTQIAYKLIKNYRYVFLARPRRFGKSLFLSTLKEIFEGNKKYFKDLYIYNKWNFEDVYPVIEISFSGDMRTSGEFQKTIMDILEDNQKKLGVKCKENTNYAICLKDLIQKTYQKYNKQVVILIDEYDKGILDNLDQLEIASENREILRAFYSKIKDNDRYIKFVFITGVSMFSKTSIFSDLNMLEDISFVPEFGNICGYTQNDMEKTISPYIEGADLKKIKEWYNGYNFLADDLYNPFDILKFIRNKFTYKNYWFETGTPTFLIKLLKKQNYFLPKLSNLVVGDELLESFDIEQMRFEVVLFQTGYLTIDNMTIDEDDEIEYKLKIPNKEVKLALNKYIISHLCYDVKITDRKNLKKSLQNENLEDFKTSLVSIFASIPYNNYVKNNMAKYEGFYATVVYLYLASLGFEVIGEDVTNHGRIDLTVKVRNAIFIMEFKVDRQDALTQIKNKSYHQKYLSEGKKIYLIGISFDESKKNISHFEWEQI